MPSVSYIEKRYRDKLLRVKEQALNRADVLSAEIEGSDKFSDVEKLELVYRIRNLIISMRHKKRPNLQDVLFLLKEIKTIEDEVKNKSYSLKPFYPLFAAVMIIVMLGYAEDNIRSIRNDLYNNNYSKLFSHVNNLLNLRNWYNNYSYIFKYSKVSDLRELMNYLYTIYRIPVEYINQYFYTNQAQNDGLKQKTRKRRRSKSKSKRRIKRRRSRS